MSACLQWTDCNVIGGGCCAKGLYGGRPSLGICAQCPECPADWRDELQAKIESNKSTQRIAGLGDVIAIVTSAVGIKPCEGCKERQDKLNKLVPFNQPKENTAT